MDEWLGFMCKEVFSAGFALYHTNELDYRKCTIYCSEQIIANIVELIQKNNLSQSNLEYINETLSSKLLPYLLMKYPLSEEAEVSSSFAKEIVEVNNL